MVCPRCDAKLQPAAPSCADCGFDIEVLRAIVGEKALRLARVTDHAHALRLRDFRRMETLLKAFEPQFPQVFMAVYFSVLPSTLSVAELTFWLLNQATLEETTTGKSNAYAVLLVIDPAARAVGMNVGYGLEPVFDAHGMQRLLRSLRTPLWHGEYVEAVQQVVKQVGKRLKHAAGKSRLPGPMAPAETAVAELFEEITRSQPRRGAPAEKSKRPWGLEKEDLL